MLTWALSPFWLVWAVSRPFGAAWSFLFQVVLVIQRASNLDRAESMSAPKIAGSRARTRMASEPPTDRPLNCTRPSLAMPGKSGLWLPVLPCSRAMAIASGSDM